MRFVEKINNSSWADWQLEKIEMDFGKVCIKIIDSEDKNSLYICCKDYIGLNIIGHWDEATIESIKIDEKGDLINESLQTVKTLYGKQPLPGGGRKNIDDEWRQVNLKLIDGVFIRVACKMIEVNVAD
ncbi:MAG: hypothetical protein JL50_13080 [Peptococcaceae bacterium BICA1-7]|nr:MAG: hypothetical protein JL50_13080 [Peptococcaceae bacterium BICA1-7]HBV99443.1 hypothetical protein [Desulfotomaculum sp.]